MLINVTEIANLHNESLLRWKINNIPLNQQDFLKIVEENHAFNYQLWHEEDKARRDDMGYQFVYDAKRKVDYFNQQRNNCMESMDEWLSTHLQPASASSCPVHSETPGMIIDRLSILSLKSYHMNIQASRQEAGQDHQNKCIEKLKIIQLQHAQLLNCLEQLITETSHKTRTFITYRQFKMYNDPTLNPELY